MENIWKIMDIANILNIYTEKLMAFMGIHEFPVSFVWVPWYFHVFPRGKTMRNFCKGYKVWWDL